MTAASRSTPRDAESMDCGPPLDSQTVIDTVTQSRLCFHLTPLLHPNHFPWMTCSGGGELMALCQETQREERHPSIPSSGVLSSALRFTGGGGVMEGVAHSPLTEAGRARGGAQRWGTYMSLTSPPLRQFKPEYYWI